MIRATYEDARGVSVTFWALRQESVERKLDAWRAKWGQYEPGVPEKLGSESNISGAVTRDYEYGERSYSQDMPVVFGFTKNERELGK